MAAEGPASGNGYPEIGRLIEAHTDELMDRWLQALAAEKSQPKSCHPDDLKDELPEFLHALAGTLARGGDAEDGAHTDDAADHGEVRWRQGWDLEDVARDYRILRYEILWYLAESLERPLAMDEVVAIGLFLDHAVESSVGAYLAVQMKEAEQTARQLRKLAAEMSQIERRERKRLASLLHDELQQLLVAAKMQLSRALSHVADERLAQAFQDVDDLLQQSIVASRTLTTELSPPMILHDVGLYAALQWLADWIQQKHQLVVEVFADEGGELPDDELRMRVFEIARELLFNVVKHAQTDRASVRLAHLGDRVRVTVEDRGTGFNTSKLLPSRDSHGVGLLSIRERLTLIGGMVEIISAPGQGTQVTVEIPYQSLEGESDVSMALESVETAPTVEASDEGQPADTAGDAIRVLLVDDHAVVRQGLAGILDSEPDIELIAEAGDGREAVDLARRLHPDVIVMDVSMPGMTGIEATRIIKKELPEVRVVGLSLHERSTMTEQMLQAGAAAYVSKDEPKDQLLAAIHGDSSR
jgi:signal transduction histidine kinase/ActR/RegA family two-component response regulator